MFNLIKTYSKISGLLHAPDITGFCCLMDGTGTYEQNSSQLSCFNRGGYWFKTEAEAIASCPKQTRGGCCYYPSGTALYQGNTTECDCAKLSPTKFYWGSAYNTISDCPVSLVAETGACCHWILNGNNYINTCEQVNTEFECQSLHQGTSQGLKYSFYPNKYCVSSDGDVVCNGTSKSTPQSELGAECVPDTDAECFKQENLLGNCCELLPDESVACTATTKSACLGYWHYYGNVKSCTSGSLCSGVYFHETENNKTYPTTASYTTLLSSTNPAEALPVIGTVYQGGLYAGIFEPGVSTVYGNRISGNAQIYKSERSGPGGSQRRWILIVSPEETELPEFSLTNIATSKYDGFYNTDTMNIQQVRNLTINGFSDWYIPSKHELEFIFKNLSYGFTVAGIAPLNKDYYLTSSIFNVSSSNKLSNQTMIYGQLNTEEKYGNVFIAPQLGTTKKYRLVRRIYLGV